MASPDAEFAIDRHQYHMWHTAALRDVFAMVQAFSNIKKPRKSFDMRHAPVVFNPGDKCLVLMPTTVKGSKKLTP